MLGGIGFFFGHSYFKALILYLANIINLPVNAIKLTSKNIKFIGS
jgi:hypothetical protein